MLRANKIDMSEEQANKVFPEDRKVNTVEPNSPNRNQEIEEPGIKIEEEKKEVENVGSPIRLHEEKKKALLEPIRATAEPNPSPPLYELDQILDENEEEKVHIGYKQGDKKNQSNRRAIQIVNKESKKKKKVIEKVTLLQKLQHCENFVTPIDFFIKDDQYQIVTEFCNGGNL